MNPIIDELLPDLDRSSIVASATEESEDDCFIYLEDPKANEHHFDEHSTSQAAVTYDLLNCIGRKEQYNDGDNDVNGSNRNVENQKSENINQKNCVPNEDQEDEEFLFVREAEPPIFIESNSDDGANSKDKDTANCNENDKRIIWTVTTSMAASKNTCVTRTSNIKSTANLQKKKTTPNKNSSSLTLITQSQTKFKQSFNYLQQRKTLLPLPTAQSNILNAVHLQPETTNTSVSTTSSSTPYPNINSTFSALARKRQHERDADEPTPDKSKAQKQVKSDESSFIQSLAIRSQRLDTTVKKVKRSTKMGIKAPTQRLRLNDTTAETVTSTKYHTENKDAEDLLQATCIEKTQISDDDDNKKQQPTTICKTSLSPIPTSKFCEGLCDRNKKGIIIGDDADNNENKNNPSILGFPKNVDPQIFINDENKDRCVICNEDFNCLVYHYVNEHRGCEVYNSRLSPSQIKFAKEGRCTFSNVSVHKNISLYEAFCIFCQICLRFKFRYWYEHLSMHTGEYAYRCIGCGLRKPTRSSIKKHQVQGCSKEIAQDYSHNSRSTRIEVEVCNLCNYVQLYHSNIERHLHMQHNIEQILPEHIETIVLLSSTDRGIATSLLNNGGVALSSSLFYSNASNTCVIDDDNDVNFEKTLSVETPPQTNPRIKKKFENNENSSLVSALGFPKNVDPQMFINDENEDRCVICNQDFIGRLVYHYVNEHRGCEIYNSRLSSSQIHLVKQGRCEVSNVSLCKGGKHYEAFCIFCQKNLRFILRYWYYHFTRHTGEFAYRCTGCGLRRPMPSFKKHQAQGCKEGSVEQDYLFNLKAFRFEANVCNLCNYVQLYCSNIEKHLHMQHNIKQILPEHIQTIALLSIPPSIIATPTGSKIYSRQLLPSYSNASNTYGNDDNGDDNDVTFDKILPVETPPQTNPPTIKNTTFEEFISCNKAPEDLINSDGSPLLLLRSHAEKNKERIIFPDDNENNDNPSMVSALGWPKNVDAQMFINDINKDRCVICNQDFIGRLVYHYVSEHRGCEIYNSRLSPLQIKLAKKGHYEVFSASLFKSRKHYEALCIFCQKKLRFTLPYWYYHFTRHTGEFAYRCTGCGLRKPRRPDFKRHQAEGCPKARVKQDYFCLKTFPIEANICNLCNYVQLHSSNITRHLHMQHNIKQILSDHIQTIVLLSIPSSIMITSNDSIIDARVWNSSGAASLPSSLYASNTYAIDGNGDDKDVTFDKILPEETAPQTDLPIINNTCEEFTSCRKTTRDLSNSDGSPSELLSSHEEKNQEGIINSDDYENNDNSSLLSALGFPKNVDPQMVINDENKDRCVICNQNFIGRLVYHYVNEHRGCEIYNSRLSPSQIKLNKEGRCEATNVSRFKNNKYYEAFCIFCQKNLRFILRYWYDHFTRHTGEFAYRCTGCGLRKPKPDFKKHQHQACLKASIAQDYFRRSKTFPIKAKVCNLCNYVQLDRSNIERHLHMQHNIKQILPEHMQTISLLSIPTSMTATSTGNKIDSRRWNKSGTASSLPSPSHTFNTCVIVNNDNNATFEKILKKETSLQANPPTINNTKFEESTISHKVICSKIITLADVSAVDA